MEEKRNQKNSQKEITKDGQHNNFTSLFNRPYVYMDWKLYAVHNDKEIKGFFGEYRWLSNFHKCKINYENLTYTSAESAYQAARVVPSYRVNLVECEPNQSRITWKKYPLLDENSDGWNARKYNVMLTILRSKFFDNIDLKQKLIETKDRYLEETNHWGDEYWGVNINNGGLNKLGEILMIIRNEIKIEHKR